MEPFNLGGHMIRKVHSRRRAGASCRLGFEAGTSPLAEAVGLGAAIDYLTEIGLDAIGEHEHELTTYALEGLGEIPGVTLRSAPSGVRGSCHFRSHERAPARRRAGARPRGRRDPPTPLLPAADAEARRRRDEPRQLRLLDGGEVDRLVVGVQRARQLFG